MTTPVCPDYGAEPTVWKAKVQMWECPDCDARFHASPPEEASDPLASAEDAFADRARALGDVPVWMETIAQTWPAPIAHTYALLRTLLRRGQIDASALVLKDFAELLARFGALAMACDLRRQGSSERQLQVAVDLFSRPMSMGGWIELADTYAGVIAQDPQHFALVEVAALWRTSPAQANARPKATALRRLLGELATWRNETIGHGVRGADLGPLIADLERFLGSGENSLHKALAPHAAVWSDFELLDVEGQSLMGQDAVIDVGPGVAHDYGESQPLCLRRKSIDQVLELRPFLTSRRCQVCDKVETFHYDSVRPGKQIPDFRLLNYESGHVYKTNGAKDAELLQSYRQADLARTVHATEGFAADVLNEEVAHMLDEQSVEKGYLSPQYLREPLTAYIADRLAQMRGGLYWLRAPAHVGKSTFVRGIDPLYRDILRDTPLRENLVVAVFYARREYQFHLAQFADHLRGAVQRAYGIRAQNKPLPTLDLQDPGPQALCAFLAEFREFGREIGRGPLLVVIDGLDELAEEHPGIADYLPVSAEALPAEVFLLLTSRPRAELAPWLQSKLDPLQSGPGRDIALEDGGYVSLLREYVRAALKSKKIAVDDALMQAILQASDARFLYFRFLVDRLVDGDIKSGDLVQFNQEPSKLIPQYLQALHARYAGTPQADLLTRVLDTLAAAEAAFTQHNQALPALAQQSWMGLPMPVLCQFVEGRPDMTPRLASCLYLLKPLLGTWRGESEGPRYRLGIKGLEDALRGRGPQVYAESIRHLFANLLNEPANESVDTRSLDLDWIARYIDGYVWLLDDASRMALASHHGAAIDKLAGELMQRGDEQGDASRGVDALSLYAAAEGALRWTTGVAAPSADLESPVLLSWVQLLIKRGSAQSDLGDPKAALQGSAQAIAILVDLRARQGEPFSPAMADSLAEAYAGRARAEFTLGDAKAALQTNTQAIAIWEDLCARAGGVLNATLGTANGLMQAYGCCCYVQICLGDLQAARQRAEQAIALMEKTGLAFNLEGMIGDFVKSFGDNEAALQLYSRLTTILEDQRSRKGVEFSPAMANSLAIAYEDCSSAQFRLGDRSVALESNALAIAIWDDLSTRLGAQFPPGMADGLATALQNRGVFQHGLGDQQAALRSVTQAISIRENLKARLGEQFIPGMADGLAGAYTARGNVENDSGDFRAALQSHTQAITILEEQSSRLGAQIRPGMANSLATAYLSRGVVQARLGDQQAALQSNAQAIAIWEDLRARLGDGFTPDMADHLATAYMKRGAAQSRLGDKRASRQSVAQAVAIGDDLRGRLGRQFTPDMANHLATALYAQALTAKELRLHKVMIQRLKRAEALWSTAREGFGGKLDDGLEKEYQELKAQMRKYQIFQVLYYPAAILFLLIIFYVMYKLDP